MAKVKIGDQEYVISRLKYKDIKKMERYRVENKLDALDFDTYVILYNLKKANSNFKMTIDEFDELIEATEIDDLRKTINDFSGFNKYIKKVESKNLIPGIGKK